MNSRKATYIYILILLPLIYFAIFLHLDTLPFRVWDESYLASHTYEMMHDHDYIVTHSFGEPEMSNTKPPLVIWFMLASCKLLGFNELSIRLPNALAGVAICFIVFFFSSAVLKSSFKGFLSVLVLISSAGFIRLHVTRSGEYDAFLVLFVTLYCLFYFLILETDQSHKRYYTYWILFTISFSLAILTKGVAAFLVTPSLFIYTLSQKKLIPLLRSKHLYLSIFFILFSGIGYYLLREHYNHGYIQAVSENELGGRYLKPQIITTPWLYIEAIVNYQFNSWLAFAFIGVFGGLMLSNGLEKRFTLFSLMIVVLLLIVISAGSTRLDWYDAPAFPFLAFLSGTGIYMILMYLFKLSERIFNPYKLIAISILLILLVCPAYSSIIVTNLSSEETVWDANSYNLTHYIETEEKAKINLNGYKIVNDWFMVRALFCQVKKWELKGQKMEIITNIQSLKKGDKVIISLDLAKSQIDQLYFHKSIDTYKNVETWLILGTKN